ncbi:MAG: AmmeMemoRadiSam system radical SAM enzyme [bacterium]
MLKEAMCYKTLNDKETECFLCNHKCKIAPSKFGFCGVRQNIDGRLYTHVYREVIAANVDPIEKKPLYHFLPGTVSFSIATAGCNFQCDFCQNWQISQVSKRDGMNLSGYDLPPEDIVSNAKEKGCQSISFTYTEPTIFFEYAYDTAKLAKKEGLANIFVTNGFMTSEALETISPYLDACNVDLKSFNEEYYKKMCKAHLKPVLDSIRLMKQLDIWVEITTLVIPDENDGEEELSSIAGFIAEVDPDIPWHVSRFHPDYKLTDKGPTPIATLRRAFSLGKKAGLRYIYIGNVLGESENTLCPQCQELLIRRRGFSVLENKVTDSVCPSCGKVIPGVFKGII